MPVHKVGKYWQWGAHGHRYLKKADAERQARAAYANGYRGDKGSKRKPTKRRKR